MSRQCSRNACAGGAVATLTYVYSDQTVVVGPLATSAEPHTYDLCDVHAQGLTVPRGWDVIRLAQLADPGTVQDDLVALVDAVREAGRTRTGHGAVAAVARQSEAEAGGTIETGRRGHLRILRDR